MSAYRLGTAPRREPGNPYPAAERIREANHRIANNLALISSMVRVRASDVAKQDRLLSSKDAAMYLEEVAASVYAVSALHRTLSDPSGPMQIDIGDHLTETCRNLVASFSLGARFELSCECGPGCLVPADQAVPLTLIVSELVINAVKYAHPAGVTGKIEVGCGKQNDGTLVLDVVDDGVGLPESFNPAFDGGLGFRIIRSLAKQLGATLEFNSDSLGLRTRILVPFTFPSVDLNIVNGHA